jgi:outer membrane protein TolC
MKALCIFALAIASIAGAETNDRYTAQQLVELAVQRNPELRSLNFSAEALKHEADQASRWQNPALEIGDAKKEELGETTNFTKIGISQTIERPGRIRAREEAAKARATSAELERKLGETELRGSVLQLIYEYKIANEMAAHAKERVDRFKTVGTFLRARVFASPQKRSEASIVRSKLLVLSRNLHQLEARRRIAWNRLNLYLGLSSEPSIAAEWFKAAPALQEDSFLARVAGENPEIQRQARRVTEIESEFTYARTERFPGLTLTGEYENGTGANPERTYGLGIAFPLPVFDAKGSAIRAAESALNAENEKRKWIVERESQELRSAIERYNAARTSLTELSVSEIPKLEKEMASTDQGFKKGQVDLLTYIEADAEHFESLAAIFDSQVAFIEARNSVYRLVGQAPQE